MANPKIRTSGVVLLVLALLCYLGAVTGLDAHGTGGRVILGVVGTLLLVVGIALVRTRTPSVARLQADQAGLHVTVLGGRPLLIEWTAIDAIWLRRLSVVFGGYLLTLRCVPDAPRPPQLHAFERRAPDGASTFLIGLNRSQSAELIHDVPTYAGSRYRPLS